MSFIHTSSSCSSSCSSSSSTDTIDSKIKTVEGSTNKNGPDLSDSSIDEILPSLRMASRDFPKFSVLRPSFFEMNKPKSLSTNSSPIKSSLKVNKTHHTKPNSALAISGSSLNQDLIKKSVRFNDLMDLQKINPQPTKRKRDSFFHRISSNNKTKNFPVFKHHSDPSDIRVESSEYSCTPDVTELSQLDASSLSEKQLKYLLPDTIEPLVTQENDETEQFQPIFIRKAKNSGEIHPGEAPSISSKVKKSPKTSTKELIEKSSPFNINNDTLVSRPPRNSPMSTLFGTDAGISLENPDRFKKPKDSKFPYLPQTATKEKVYSVQDLNETSFNTQDNTLKSKSFSLRLQDRSVTKPSSKGTPDVSYDHEQVDILDQIPPNLPNINTAVTNLSTENIEKSKSNVAIELFDTSISKDKLKNIVIKLSKALDNNDIPLKKHSQLNIQDAIEVWETLSEEAIDKLEVFRIQQLNNTKTLSQNEEIILNKNLNENTLKAQINHLNMDANNSQIEIARLQSTVESQSKEIIFERESSGKIIEQLRSQIANLKQLKYANDDKDMISDRISSLIDRFKNELIEEENKEKLELLQNQKQNSTDFDILKLIFMSVASKKDKMEEVMNKNFELENNNRHLLEVNEKLKESSLHLSSKSRHTDEELHRSQTKIQELTDISNSLESQLKESLRKLKNTQFSLSEEKESNNELKTKVSNMENVLNEQLNVITAAQDQIDRQSKDLNDLINTKETLKLVTRQKENCLKDSDANKTKIDDLNFELEQLKKNYSLFSQEKDLEIVKLKQVSSDLADEKRKLIDELKEKRSKLTDTISNVRDLERRQNSNSSTITDLQTSNRSLRSEMLQSNSVRNHYRRTLVQLLISMLHVFQGIIDEKSLCAARDDLKVTDKFFDDVSDHDKELLKLNDCSYFVQEAISLVINDYWNLHKTMTTNKRASISSCSLNTLQRINETQTSKIKKLEFKIQYYDSLFKKVNQNELNSKDQLNNENVKDENEEGSSTSFITTRITKQEKRMEGAKRMQKLDYR